MTADRRRGTSRIVRAGALTVLAGGIVLGLFPTLALAADAGSAPSDPAAGTSTAPDPAATGGASTDPAQPSTTSTDPTATGDPAASTTDPAVGATGPAAGSGTTADPTTGTVDPATAAPASSPDPVTSTDPSLGATAPSVASSTPVACSSTPEAVAAGCPTLVLEQADATPATSNEGTTAPEAPAPQSSPAPAPVQTAPGSAPTLVTHVPQTVETPIQPLMPFHGAAPVAERRDAVAPRVRPAAREAGAPYEPAPVLTAQATPVLVPELPRVAAAEPRANAVRPDLVALRVEDSGAGALALQDSLPPLLKSVATSVEPPVEESSAALGSTGGDEPLPLPPRDPSESPTGLGAPSSGGGQHGSVGIFAILTALVLLFAPRMVRRLPRVGAVAPRVGYRLVLERPG